MLRTHTMPPSDLEIPMAPREADGVRVITKYPNRRLYDTVESRYITLDELAAQIRGGSRVKVVDAKSGADLTRQVLTQVILEEQDRLDVLPVELLHLVIQAQGTVHQAPLTRFLAQAFQQFATFGDAWTRGMASAWPWAGMGAGGSGGPAGSGEGRAGTGSAPGGGPAAAGGDAAREAMREAAAAGAGLLRMVAQAFPGMGGPPAAGEAAGGSAAARAGREGEGPPAEEAQEGEAGAGEDPGEARKESAEKQGGAPGAGAADLDAVRRQMDDLLRRLRGGGN